MERRLYHFASISTRGRSCQNRVLKVAYKAVLQQTGLYRGFVPVEEKGYKNMINVPDWPDVPSFITESKTQFEKAEFIFYEACPFQESNNNGPDTGMPDANGLHASCTAFLPDLFRDANAILFPLHAIIPF
jgi:hypothetical protein